jgi:hypothetical protein
VVGELRQRVRSHGAGNRVFVTVQRELSDGAAARVRAGGGIQGSCLSSGRMLLAALDARRVRPGGEPRLTGVDADADAIRICQPNLLASYGRARGSRELHGFTAV